MCSPSMRTAKETATAIGGNLRLFASQISPPRNPARTVAITQGTTVNPPRLAR